MKKILQWVIAATLVCGTSVITSCKSDSDDNTAQEQAKGDRKEFIQHTRQNLKTLAENLNFSTWNSVTYLNQYINENILLNDDFDHGIRKAIRQEIQKSLKPLPAEVAAQMGKKYEVMLNLADFDYIFKMTANGFDVTPNPEDGMVIEVVDPYYPQYGAMVGLKGSGEEYIQPSQALSNDSVAVIVKFPAHFEFTLSTKQNGAWVPGMNASFDLSIVHGDYGMELPSDATSMLLDAWNLSGTVSTAIPGDATTLEFNIGQDPTTDQAGMTFNYTHNGVKTVGLRAVLTNANGITDFSQLDFNSTSSILSVLTAVMAGKSIDDLTLTLLDDLTTTVKVADCQKVMQLQTVMAAARRNYADQQTIDGYTQQLNELISATMTCKGLNQQIPMKLATTKLGVDWWTVPALKFADENGYVPLTEVLDKESIEYGINIIDHAAEPMQRSIIVVRQLAQALQKMQSAFLQTKYAK